MKSYLVLALTIASIFLSGCGTSSTPTKATRTAAVMKEEEETPQIQVGMTKAQVLEAWGEPSGKQVSGSGEIWVWGGQNWLRAIPYAGPFMKVQTSKVLFGPSGRVKDFRLTDQGDVMTNMEGRSGGFNAW